MSKAMTHQSSKADDELREFIKNISGCREIKDVCKSCDRDLGKLLDIIKAREAAAEKRILDRVEKEVIGKTNIPSPETDVLFSLKFRGAYADSTIMLAMDKIKGIERNRLRQLKEGDS